MQYEEAVKFLQQSDPILGQVIDQIGRCRLDEVIQQGDLFAALSRAIIHQQISTKAAGAIYRRFLLLYPHQPSPTALDILDTPDELLLKAGLSRPKVTYLKDLAQKVIDGLPTLLELETMDDEAIVQTLTQVKGIGRWTVQMLLIFRLQRQDVLPVDDLGVRAAIRKIYSLPELPNRQTIVNLGQNWQPYRSIASWYLWRSLELK
ncbi:DNA-3-methyladenine glycosylase family protein [Aliterella atlantica]|uniref:DNA-3-methyladenine glycosylase II n=1 Tax=Aliterella atlantica CENA595 TaxID=1618023 RepID=A0A0D8ZQB0_9CYAN|nr:DNA-3-methyladenine glycosylase [Aliterella atlantica]KJH71003.1 Fe-S cluster assembly protein HesB [Aliterella atlantica CENA595]